MIDYEKKYKEYTEGWMLIPDVSQEYPDCNGFEKCVISMRKEGWTYSEIQSKLGMPSKKRIRSVLLIWAPELIDNSVKKVVNISEYEAELYNIIKNHNNEAFNVWGEQWRFYIKNNKLYYNDGKEWEFSDWDLDCQAQILDQIKNN